MSLDYLESPFGLAGKVVVVTGGGGVLCRALGMALAHAGAGGVVLDYSPASLELVRRQAREQGVPVLLVQEERVLALGHHLANPDCEDFLLVDFGDGVGGASDEGAQPFQYALHLALLLGLRLAPGVAHLNDGERLDKDRGAAGGDVVDAALHLAARLHLGQPQRTRHLVALFLR